MVHNIDGMVVVASGTSEQITRWSVALRKRKIQFAVTSSVHEDGVPQPNYLEIWVEQDDADKARTVLIQAERGQAQMLW